jgi:biotin synthase-related radical SAM superfamily protein
MRLQHSAAADRELIEDCLTLMGEARLKIDVISRQTETEDEIFSRLMLLDSMSLLVLRISDSLSEDIKVLPGYRDRFQIH